jgi:hypothetical protein
MLRIEQLTQSCAACGPKQLETIKMTGTTEIKAPSDLAGQNERIVMCFIANSFK